MAGENMKVGDLVYHKEDIARNGLNPIPGLIVATVPFTHSEEAIVYFTDRTFSEYHIFEDLIRVETHEYNSRIQNAKTR